MADEVLLTLAETIAARRHASGEVSYTRKLLDAGVAKCARKFGEEAVETVIAAVASVAVPFAAGLYISSDAAVPQQIHRRFQY